MTNSIYFNFYDLWVQVNAQDDEVLELLKNDFSFFYVEKGTSRNTFLSLDIFKESPKVELIPQTVASMQSSSCITYEFNGKRFNNYYDKALGIFDFSLERAELYSNDLTYLHEISYLMILSRVGKKMDLKGLHRIHAFSVLKKNILLVGLMPMKGGKSTLFMELAKDSNTSIYSDDSPLVSLRGEVMPFPLRVGLERIDKMKFQEYGLSDYESNVYEINRRIYGKKKLIKLEAFKNKIGGDYEELVLFSAKRLNAKGCTITPVPKIKLFFPVFTNMVIGFGLPIIIEYFWEEGLEDFGRKAIIGIRRLFASFSLLFKSKTYQLCLGTDPKINAETINSYFFSSKDLAN